MQMLQTAITEDRLANLPEPIRRYMIYSGVLGKPMTQTANVKYTGTFRLGADKPWMQMQADQVYTVDSPGFQWKANFKLFGLPLMSARDTFSAGHTHMFGKLMNLFTVVEAQDTDELLQGTMVRYLQEMMWFPTAYLMPYITWESVDTHCADATFTHQGKSVTGRFYVDDSGRLVNFVSERYAETNGEFHLHTWSTPVTDYAVFGDFRVPRTGFAIWEYPDEDFLYINVHVTDITHNQPIRDF